MKFLGLSTALAVLLAAESTAHRDGGGEQGTWSGWGGGILNKRWASWNKQISSSNIKTLKQHCKISYPKGVSATPTIHRGIVYYPTWNGLFVALDYRSCTVKWQINVTKVVTDHAPPTPNQLALTNPISRTSPQINNGVLYFGTLLNALIIAVDLQSGQTLGITQINPHPFAVVTMSPTFYDNKLFVGASSVEGAAPDIIPGYTCCSFAGNVIALSFNQRSRKFTTVWDVSMLPPGSGQGNNTWSGASVWGSQPSIDTKRGQVFFASGNLYTAPAEFLACEAAARNSTTQNNQTTSCLPNNVWQETVLALDISSGKAKWIKQLTPLDAWNTACLPGGTGPKDLSQCPDTPGPDSDFGMAPTFVSGRGRGSRTPDGKDMVTLGQKNGFLWALDAATGQVEWIVVTSPAGLTGGLSWGVAADEGSIYFTALNSGNAAWKLQPSNVTVYNSGYGAANLATGSFVWEVPAPRNGSSYVPPGVVGDLVLTGVTAAASSSSPGGGRVGSLLALDKKSGEVLVEYQLDAPYRGGAAVQGRYVLFGSGYSDASNGSFYVLQVGK